MEWLLLALLAGGGAFAARKVSSQRAVQREQVEEVESVRRLAEEDVTVLGEQLQRLGDEVADRELDSATEQDYQKALDAYESAKWKAPRLREPDEISVLIDTLASGRYALACVQARVAGREVPELRVPCFFNPQHGPSVHDVMWTSARHGTRRVPACGQCAARVAAREKPEVRTVKIGSRTVPYWEAGAAYMPYTIGYFSPTSFTMGAAGVAWVWDMPTDPGIGHHGGGHDSGGFDSGGGFDGGGFDSGGGGDGGGL